MTSDAFITIVGSVLTVIAVLIAVYIFPMMKSVISEKDMATLLEVIEIFVKSADQLFTKEEWQEKKAFVMSKVMDFVQKHFNVKLTEAEIDALVEGFVNQIHENGCR